MSRHGNDDAWNRRRRATPKAEVDVADRVIVPADGEAIVARLRDVEFVAGCLPGLVPGSLAPAEDGAFRAQPRQTAVGVTATWDLVIGLDAPPARQGVAVALSGSEARLHLTMAGTADVDVGAGEAGGTPVDYRGHVAVEGRLAATGGPIIRRIVGEILERFVAALAASGREAPRTAASAAIASGAPAVGRSFRFHRPRGPLCGAGWCAQCERGGALACRTPDDGAGAPRDLLRPIGRIAERFPPWFYERRLLRPRPLRRHLLHAVRHTSRPRRRSATLPAGDRRDRSGRTRSRSWSSATPRRPRARSASAGRPGGRSSASTRSACSGSSTARRCARSASSA